MQDTYQLLLAAFVVGFLLHRSVSAGNHPSLIRQANRKSRRTDLSQSAGSTGSRVVLLPLRSVSWVFEHPEADYPPSLAWG
jgi:hypothetical protein